MTSRQRRAFEVALKLIFFVAGMLGVLCSAIAFASTDTSTDEFISVPAMSLSRDGLLKVTAVVLAGFWFVVAFAVRTCLRLRRSEANSTQYQAAIPRDVETGGPMEDDKAALPVPGYYPPFTHSPPLPLNDDTNTGTCIACDMTFTSADQLTAHTAASHSGWRPSLPSPYKCIDCPATFTQPYTLRNHMQNAHRFAALVPGPGQLECVDCPATFGTKYALLDHVESVHFRFPEDFYDDSGDTVMPMECPVAGCGIWFLEDELDDHSLHIHKIPPGTFSARTRPTEATAGWGSFATNTGVKGDNWGHPYGTNGIANANMAASWGRPLVEPAPNDAFWPTCPPPRPPSSASTANDSAYLDHGMFYSFLTGT
ncbi:hypothetical protein C8F01DRAFT_753925 [Mycena amicta]|nr:hypothetical protein C8F01DRAFT_753925 [Mycena amicta]